MRTVACGFGDASGAPGGGGGKHGGAHVAGRQVCWMVFEYADKGTLVVSHRFFGLRLFLGGGLWGRVSGVLGFDGSGYVDGLELTHSGSNRT